MKETRLERVINQVKNARQGGNKAWIFNENGKIKDSVICGDILPLLEEMKDYEINVTDKYIENFIRKSIEGETIDDNTYNRNACISNDIDWKEIKTEDYHFFLIKIHLFGDIRGGYSEWFVLKMNWFEDFQDLSNSTQYKTINNRYSVDIYLNQECYDLIDNETQENLGEYCSTEVDDLLAEIAEEGKEVM